MANKFKFLSMLMILSLALTACGGASESSDSMDTASSSNEGSSEIVFSTYSGDFNVQCADGWTCTEEYGGSISHDETYNSLMLYDVYGTDAESLLETNVAMVTANGNREVTETYEWTDGAMASVILDNDNGQYFWVTVFDAGMDEALLKCQANFAEGTFENMQADVEMMCGSSNLI